MERNIIVRGKSVDTGNKINGTGVKWLDDKVFVITEKGDVQIIPTSLIITNLPDKETFVEEVLSQEEINNLHEFLMQTLIDYLKKNNIFCVDEISFDVDSLKESINHGKWIPSTDSSLLLSGYEDGKNKIIGYSM